jgi:ADP-heptose:LPS heptosyltransferase
MAKELAFSLESHRVVPLPTPGPLDLAALLERSRLLITPEGGAAHLAAVTNIPALVLWSEGPFKKWRSLNDKHRFLKAKDGRVPFKASEVFVQFMEQEKGLA